MLCEAKIGAVGRVVVVVDTDDASRGAPAVSELCGLGGGGRAMGRPAPRAAPGAANDGAAPGSPPDGSVLGWLVITRCVAA